MKRSWRNDYSRHFVYVRLCVFVHSTPHSPVFASIPFLSLEWCVSSLYSCGPNLFKNLLKWSRKSAADLDSDSLNRNCTQGPRSKVQPIRFVFSPRAYAVSSTCVKRFQYPSIKTICQPFWCLVCLLCQSCFSYYKVSIFFLNLNIINCKQPIGGKESTFFPAPQWEPGKKVLLSFPPNGTLQLMWRKKNKKHFSPGKHKISWERNCEPLT